MYINSSTFRQWWDVFHSDSPLTELRILGKKAFSGYFKDCETALKAIMDYPYDEGLYACINAIKDGCYSRKQRDVLLDTKTTTSDNDIEGREWLLIDLDPERPSGVNATDSEVLKARELMKDVGIYLRDRGFPAPVIAMSGNGYHLYYKIKLKNTDANKSLLSQFLCVLDMFYSNDDCKIDVTVFNASRIAKVIGSKSAKGIDSPERPQRESFFLKVPEEIETTDIALIQKVMAEIPVKEQPNRFNGYSDSFDIESFIRDHNIDVVRRSTFSGGQKLLLRECPFDPNHKAPDSAIFIMNNGAIGFKCLHNSCSAYTWKDVRVHYDPNAYTRRDREEYARKRDFYSQAPRPAPVIVEETDERGKKWYNMGDIEWVDPNTLTYIPTGIAEIDRKINGLALGDVTILSGLAGAGKSSLINNVMLSAIQHGYKCAIWSGELLPSRFKSWLNQAAAGANFVKRGSGETEYYYCPKEIGEKIDKWTDGKIFLYNNNYGNHSSQIIDDIKKCVKERGTQLITIDNKMALNLDSYDGDKNEREAGLINELNDFAMASKIHIILVCHPRKEQLNSLLRMESIAGNSDLYNRASNVFLCHRVGRDFERRASDFFGHQYVTEIMTKGYNEVIEVAKNRSHGTKDFVAGLYYEAKTRRFLNTKDEYTVYGWKEGYIPPQSEDQRLFNALVESNFEEEVELEDLPY